MSSHFKYIVDKHHDFFEKAYKEKPYIIYKNRRVD